MSCLNTITLEVLNVLDPIAGEILLARYASEDREFTKAAAAPPLLVELYIQSGEVWG